MILPSPSLLWLAALWLLAAIPASIWPQMLPLWLGAGGLGMVAVLVDAVQLLGIRHPVEITRRLPTSLPVGLVHAVPLTLKMAHRHALRFALYDHHPASFETTGLPLQVALPPVRGTHIPTVTLSYYATPLARGTHVFGRVELRLFSGLGLLARRMWAGEGMTIKVYPNFTAIARYALLATDHRLSRIGVLQRRRRGEGLDFRQLREYREGDPQRQIDWKASSRMQKLISREYQDERDQQVVFLLDCGRRMTAMDGGLSHFDHTLNAMLLLSYVALRQGDAVGMATFAADTPRFFAPRKGEHTVNTLLNTVFDLEPGLLTPDYYQAAVDLFKRIKKRALIIVLSNLRDEDDSTLRPALALLKQRHLVMFASLKEQSIEDVLITRPDDLDAALTFAAACDMQARRQSALRRLNAGGVLSMDVEPRKLAMELVNQYLELKRTARL